MKKNFGICGAVLLVIGLLIFVFSEKSSIGMVGGTDGPTVLLISGKAWIFSIILGVLLIVVSCIIPIKKKK